MGSSYSSTTLISGTVDEGYESVREMFTANFMAGREREAQLCVYVGERRVVDLWGSATGDKSYDGDSLQCVFSSSKAVTAIAVASLAQRGLLNYKDRVATYWPEFAQHQKGELRIEDILRHEGGLPNLHTSIDPQDLLPSRLSNGVVADIIAKDYPVFPTKTPREYHNLTAGWIMNEVFQRVSPGNVSIGTWLRREICDPLGADAYLGITDKETPRVRDLVALSTYRALAHSLLPESLGSEVTFGVFVFAKVLRAFRERFLSNEKRGYAQPFVSIDPGTDPADFVTGFFNSDNWRRGESPHGNIHASARGLARLAAVMANGGELGGVRVLTTEGWRQVHANPVVREDASMNGCRTEFTQGGVNVFTDYGDDKPGERVLKSGRAGFIGWLGFGGSIIMWRPDLHIGLGYACTLITWWDMANTKARKLQKEVVLCTKALNEKSLSGTEHSEESVPAPVPVA